MVLPVIRKGFKCSHVWTKLSVWIQITSGRCTAGYQLSIHTSVASDHCQGSVTALDMQTLSLINTKIGKMCKPDLPVVDSSQQSPAVHHRVQSFRDGFIQKRLPD